MDYIYKGDSEEVFAEHRQKIRYYETLFHPVYTDLGIFRLEWLVEDLLPVGYLCLLAGPPKSGKTCLATAIALSVANGTEFAGKKTTQSAVLWLSAEENTVERYELLRQSSECMETTPLFTCYHRLDIDDEEGLEAISHWIHLTGAKLLVVDPLLGAIKGRSLADSWAARKTLRKLKEFCADHCVTALVLHHHKRDAFARHTMRVADNAQLAATASMNLVLKSTRRAPGIPTGSRLVTLTSEGRGTWANSSIHLMSSGPLDYAPMTGKIDEKEELRPLDRRVLEVVGENEPTCDEIVLACGENTEGSVRNAVSRLRRLGFLELKRNSINPPTYRKTPKCAVKTVK